MMFSLFFFMCKDKQTETEQILSQKIANDPVLTPGQFDKKIFDLMKDQKYVYLGGYYLLNYYTEIMCDLKMLDEPFSTYETGNQQSFPGHKYSSFD